MGMKLKRKCQCPSESHGHNAGECNGIATEPDGLCEPCHERAAEELSRLTERDRPLARLSKHERRTNIANQERPCCRQSSKTPITNCDTLASRARQSFR